MNNNKALLVTIASFACAAMLCAQPNSERELAEVEKQHEEAIAAAAMRVEIRYQLALEKLLQRATENGDLETAAKVREKLAALKPRDEPAESTTDDTEPLIGKWVHKSSSGFVGEDEFLADGTFRSRIGYGTWKKVGSFIETTVGRYVDYYRLPVRDGKLYGTNENGTFSIILTEIPR